MGNNSSHRTASQPNTLHELNPQSTICGRYAHIPVRQEAFHQLASIELQLIYQYLDIGSFLSLAHTNTRCLREVTKLDSIAWKSGRTIRIQATHQALNYWEFMHQNLALIRRYGQIRLQTYPYSLKDQLRIQQECECLATIPSSVQIRELDVSVYSPSLIPLMQSPIIFYNLHALRISPMLGSGLIKNEFMHAVSLLPHLDTLVLSKDWRTDDSTATIFESVGQCQHLTSLSILVGLQPYQFNDRTYLSRLSTVKLRDLHLANGSQWNQSDLGQSFLCSMLENTYMKELRRLKLQQWSCEQKGDLNQPMNLELLRQAFQALENLEIIEFTQCRFTEHLLPIISQLPRFHTLIYSDCYRLFQPIPKPPDLQLFIDTTPQLRLIQITTCDEVLLPKLRLDYGSKAKVEIVPLVEVES